MLRRDVRVVGSARFGLPAVIFDMRGGVCARLGVVVAGCGIDVLAVLSIALRFAVYLRVGVGVERGVGRRRFCAVIDDAIVDRLARNRLRVAFGSAVTRGAASHAGAAIGFGFRIAVGALFLVDQRLPIGDRYLVVIWVDFAERQEAVAVAAIVHEGGLQ